MRKIPTLFVRRFEGHQVTYIEPTVTSGMEWVLEGEGTATEKIDGSCCAVIGGRFFRRYDAKKGKTPPANAIPCCEPDPVTGHWPHWVPVDFAGKEDVWYIAAYRNSNGETLSDGTYEAIGPHFQNDPYGIKEDVLERHGIRKLPDVPRTFEGIRKYLEKHYIEGIVFWKDGEPKCKIKRKDFGFPWNRKTDSKN